MRSVETIVKDIKGKGYKTTDEAFIKLSKELMEAMTNRGRGIEPEAPVKAPKASKKKVKNKSEPE